MEKRLLQKNDNLPIFQKAVWLEDGHKKMHFGSLLSAPRSDNECLIRRTLEQSSLLSGKDAIPHLPDGWELDITFKCLAHTTCFASFAIKFPGVKRITKNGTAQNLKLDIAPEAKYLITTHVLLDEELSHERAADCYAGNLKYLPFLFGDNQFRFFAEPTTDGINKAVKKCELILKKTACLKDCLPRLLTAAYSVIELDRIIKLPNQLDTGGLIEAKQKKIDFLNEKLEPCRQALREIFGDLKPEPAALFAP